MAEQRKPKTPKEPEKPEEAKEAKQPKAPRRPQDKMQYILATDVGSTTTKARFFRRTESNEWRFVVAGEAPTTVESPYEDVTLGVRNSVREVEELTGHQILSPNGTGVIVPYDGKSGVDLYCTTSSAGGGLQMVVAGVVKIVTAESANRAALGAGAIVMNVFASDDGTPPYQKVQFIRNLRPDMILMAGGTDGGVRDHVLEMAELLKAANPKPRLGAMYSLPLIYAGNRDLRSEMDQILGESFALDIVDNIRPVMELENSEPARRAVHELFMEHVMSHAPGYAKLMKWTDIDIMPTPAGEGLAMQLIANNLRVNTLGVGLGGATTNIYSVVDGKFVRSVSANLGMSYSICNVLKEAGIDNIMRWLPFELTSDEVGARLMNKMIRPTTIPHTLEELILEHACAREALRLGLVHHRSIATRLKGVKKVHDIGDMFSQELGEESYIQMMNIQVVAGTGGLLSHSPRRIQSLLILTDAFQLEGVTRVFQDSVFMMPHLGILSTVYPEAAWQIFDKDCLVRLGTVIAARGQGTPGEDMMTVTLEAPDSPPQKAAVRFGEIRRIPLPRDQTVTATISPQKKFDVGEGPGRERTSELMGGEVGIILDARGRPLTLPEDPKTRMESLRRWFGELDVYPREDESNWK